MAGHLPISVTQYLISNSFAGLDLGPDICVKGPKSRNRRCETSGERYFFKRWKWRKVIVIVTAQFWQPLELSWLGWLIAYF